MIDLITLLKLMSPEDMSWLHLANIQFHLSRYIFGVFGDKFCRLIWLAISFVFLHIFMSYLLFFVGFYRGPTQLW